MKALIMIVNAGFADTVIDVAQKCGAGGATVMTGRGTASNKLSRNFLGINYDPEREIIISVVKDDVALEIMQQLKEKYGHDTPAKAVCFLLPVDKATISE